MPSELQCGSKEKSEDRRLIRHRSGWDEGIRFQFVFKSTLEETGNMKRVLLIFLGIALRARCTQLDVITGADALVPESTNTLKEVHRHSI